MFCKKCGKEIDDKAVMCIHCAAPVETAPKKKSLFKKWWFWVVVVAIIGIVAGGTAGSGEPTNTPSGTTNEQIVYEKVDLRTMIDDLDGNAMKAENTYQDKYVEVVGRITNFDSDGAYISIEPINANEWSFITVTCNIKNDAQRNFLMEKEIDDTVTIKGKITSVGEILGYSINIAEVA